MRDPSAQVEVRTLPDYRSRLHQIATWIVAALLCLAATAYFGVTRAQSPQPMLVVMPVVQVKSLGQIPFVIVAGPPEALPANSLIRIRGLPAGIAPSESRRGATGSWDVPLSAAPRLKLNVPEGLSGRLDFVVTLVDAKGTVLAESPSALVMEVVASGSAEAVDAREQARLDESRRTDEARDAERRKAEEIRLAAVVKRAEEMRLEVEKVEAALKAEEARKLADAEAEAARKVEEAERLARAEEARKVAQARKVEDERKAAEAKQAKMAEEQARKLAAEAETLARAEEARKAAQAKKVDDERKAAEAQQARMAQEAEKLARAEEARKVAQARKVEDERKAAETKQARMAQEAEKPAREEKARKIAEAKDEETRRAEGQVSQLSSSLTAAPGATVSALPEQRHALAPTASNPTAPATMAQPRQSERLFNRGERYRTDKPAEARQTRMAQEAEKPAREEDARKIAEAKDEETRRVEGVSQISSSPTAAPGTTVSALPEQRHALAPPASSPTAPATTAQPTQSERLFNRGERYRTEGNIVVARQYFLRAAQMGLARAAFKLAETYDPYVHQRLNVNADLAEAKRWYGQAVQLGAEDAKARLAQLGQE